MRLMKSMFGFIILFYSCSVVSHSISQTLLDKSLFEKTDHFVEKMMAVEKINGLSYAVLLNGKSVYKNGLGYANLEWKIPAKPDTLYAIASITKLLSTTAIHYLLKSKNRSVDEAIGNFLPDLPPAWQSLTVKQLLSHGSGLPGYVPAMGVNPESPQAIIKAMQDKPFEFKPGERNSYNQTGYLLLLMMVESLTGGRLEEYLHKLFFAPLGMKQTQYGNISDVIPNRATQYRLTDAGVQHDLRLIYTPPIYAAAGINSSVDEMSLWLEALLGGKILDQETLDSSWVAVPLNSGQAGTYSMGWQVIQGNDFSSVSHGGGDFSEVKHYRHHDSDDTVTVIVLTNGANWRGVQDINTGIADHFMPGLLDPSIKLFYDLKSAVAKNDMLEIKQLYRAFRARYAKAETTSYSSYGYRLISSEDPVNYLGFWLLEEKRPRDAVRYFKLNTKDYPKSVNAWDSLAEGYEAIGQWEKAEQALHTARELLSGENDPYYSMVMEHLARLKAKLD